MMKKLRRFLMAAVVGLCITIGLAYFMMLLININDADPIPSNLLTTQIKISSSPGLKPAREINADSNKKHHQLPAKRTIKLPIDHKSLITDIKAQEADGDQTDPNASPSRQQILLYMGSRSQAVVKLAGKFNVIGNDPEYPKDALLDGLEGWVDTMVHLNQDGSVQRVEVLDAGPAGVFDDAVVAAVSEWKVQLSRHSEQGLADAYFHRFEFKITQ